MNLKETFFILFTLLLCGACRELPLYIGGDPIVASVEKKTLKTSDLDGVVPAGSSPEDSLSIVTRYVEKWIQNSVKLLESERVFASSAHDIEQMVEEYRNSLMVRRLDKHHISENFHNVVSDAEIEEYYRKNGDNFKLNTQLVKGRILTFPKDYKETKELLKQMSTIAGKESGDFKSICEKKRFDLVEFDGEWVDYSEFLSYLPIARSGRLPDYTTTKGVQQLEGHESRYYFQITDVKSIGDVEPLERVKSKITYLLNNKKQLEFLGEYDDSLLQDAYLRDVIRNYVVGGN